MASVNKVILIGNLGGDPTVRYMPNNDAVANFTIATTDSWKDKSGAKQERTEWHNIVMYRKLAEIAGEYLKKGYPVYVEGRLQTRKWQAKDGSDRYTTEIIADQMQMLGSRNGGGSGGNAGSNNNNSQPNNRSQQNNTSQQNGGNNKPSENDGFNDGFGNQTYSDDDFDDNPFA